MHAWAYLHLPGDSEFGARISLPVARCGIIKPVVQMSCAPSLTHVSIEHRVGEILKLPGTLA